MENQPGKGGESQDNKNSPCKPEFRMSWGDKVLTEEREFEKKKKKEEIKGKTAEHMNTNSKEGRGHKNLHEKNLFSA